MDDAPQQQTFADMPILSRLAQETFESNQFSPEMRSVYLEALAKLKREFQARPGFATVTEMLSETVAYTYVLRKTKDALPTATSLYWNDYEKLLKMFFGAIDRLMALAKLDDVESSVKREVASVITRSALDVIDKMPVGAAVKNTAKQAIGAVAAEHLV